MLTDGSYKEEIDSMGQWKGIYNTDKKVNKKVAMGILIALFLQALGIFAMLGFDLAQPIADIGFSILNLLMFAGTLWIAYGLHKYKIGS